MLERVSWIPEWVLRPGLGLSRSKTVQVGRGLATDPALDKIKRGRSIQLEVHRNATLERRISLPRTAKRKAHRMADVELRQTLPLQGKGMVWRLTRPVVSKDAIAVDAFVLKTSHITALANKVAEHGGRLNRISVAGVHGLEAFMDNRKRRMRGAGIWVLLSLLAPLGLLAPLAWADWTATDTIRAQRPALQSQLAALTEAAVSRRDALAAQADTKATLQEDIGKLEAMRGRSWILAELTRIVPDNFWISELVFDGTDIRFTGHAKGSVVGLITDLQQAGWTRRALLDGPVVPDGFLETSRFDVLIVLATKAEQ